MPAQQGKTPKKISIDFTGVERGGGGRNPHVPEGDYLVQIVGCTLRSKKDDPSKKHLAWDAIFKEATAGNEAGIGKKHTHRTGLSKESLWNLRGLLIDMLGERNVPQSAVDVPIAAIVKKKPLVGFTMVDDEYDGKETSKVAGTFSKSDWADLKAQAAASDDDEDEDEEEDEDEDEDEEEETEEEEEEEEEEEDEEEEEEEPAPKKSKKSKKEKAAKKEKKAKKSKKPVVEDDDDEDDEDELDLDDL